MRDSRDRVADHGLEIDDLIGANSPCFHQLLFAEKFILANVQHGDMRVDELATVFVAGDQEDTGVVVRSSVSEGG